MRRCLCKARIPRDCVCGQKDKPHYVELLQNAVFRMREEREDERKFLTDLCDKLRLSLTRADDYYSLFYVIRSAVDEMELFLEEED